MARPIEIDSAADPRVAPYRDVRERELEAREGLFIGETLVVLEAMLEVLPRRHARIHSVLASARMLPRVVGLLERTGVEVPIYVATDEVLAELTGIDLHRGVLAAGERAGFAPIAPNAFMPSTPPRTILVAEEITNVDNVGQLFRIAAAFACDAVLLSPGCHDPLYRKSLRVSTGNALKVPSIRTESWPDDLAEFVRRFDLALVATAIQSSVPIGSIDPPERVAVVVGHESLGVSRGVRALAHHVVRIPMAPGIDSLNVAVSAAIALDRLSRGVRG